MSEHVDGPSSDRVTGSSSPPRYLTTSEAASYLRLSAHALRCMRHRGDAPPAAKVGRGLLWERSDLDEWVLQRRSVRPDGKS